jgi:UDP-N-acetylmuramoylalanine--D-glutamate ligase
VFILNGPVLFIGKGKSNLSAAHLIRHFYPQAEISFFDEKKDLSDFSNYVDVIKKTWAHIVLSPGAPDYPWVQDLIAEGALVHQELDIAACYLTQERVYAITGSVGKSTCTWVIAEALKALGHNVFAGANFGTPLCSYILSVHKKEREVADYLILELSSFQIERMAFMVDRALILNLHSNHLDRHGSLENYYLAKLRIINFSREGLWGLSPGGDLLSFSTERALSEKIHWINVDDFKHIFKKAPMIGEHNQSNLSAALVFLSSPQLEEKSLVDAFLKIPALPHRIELFKQGENYFVNDSKGTTIESVLTAYKALRERFDNAKMFWLLGGRDKDLPWIKIKTLWSDKNLEFVFFGEAAGKIKKETSFQGLSFKTLQEALDYSKTQMKGEDVLVLSPGGSSLDEFKCFEERGNFFKSYILSNF